MGVERGGNGVRGEEREKERREAVSNHGSTFSFFSFPVKSASEKRAFVDGVGCKADVAVLSEPHVHFAALTIPFCVSVKIRERTITIISLQGIPRAAHASNLNHTGLY